MTRRKKRLQKIFFARPKINPEPLGKGSKVDARLGSKAQKKGLKLQLLVRQLLAAFNGKLASLQSLEVAFQGADIFPTFTPVKGVGRRAQPEIGDVPPVF
jgi:hypothetical protein